MNIKLNGEIVTIKSNIPFESLKKVGKVLIHEDKKPVYGVTVGTVGAISNVGATFTYASADGMACMNIACINGEGDIPTKEDVVDTIGSELAVLKNYEETIVNILEDMMSDRAALSELIEMA